MNIWGTGIITEYQFLVSADNKGWKLVSEGEFSNIKNNPLFQTKILNARFTKFRALKNTKNNNNTGYAEIGIISK